MMKKVNLYYKLIMSFAYTIQFRPFEQGYLFKKSFDDKIRQSKCSTTASNSLSMCIPQMNNMTRQSIFYYAYHPFSSNFYTIQ